MRKRESPGMVEKSEMRDVVIAGGGYVGLSVAVAVADAAPHLKLTLVDAAPADALSKDERASAIAAAAGRMLDRLGIWDGLLDHAQPTPTPPPRFPYCACP